MEERSNNAMEVCKNSSKQLKIQSTMPMPTKMPHPKLIRRHSTVQPPKINNNFTSTDKARNACNQRQDILGDVQIQQSNQGINYHIFL